MPSAPGDRGQVDDAVGRAADRQQHAHRVLERLPAVRILSIGRAARGHRHRRGAGRLGDADAVGGHARVASAPPGSAMPSASAMQAIVLAVPITEQVPTLATSWLLTRVDLLRRRSPPARNSPQ